MFAATEENDPAKTERRRLSRQQIIQHVQKSLLYTAFDVRWIPNSATLAVIGQYPNNNGALSLYQLQRGQLKTVIELRVKVPLKCCTVAHNSAHQDAVSIATGDIAGGLQLLDVERLSGLSSPPGSRTTNLDSASVFSVPQAHDSIVNAIDGARYAGPPEIATASRDGCVKIWDTRQSTKPVVALSPADPARTRDCWTVRFGNSFDPDERMVAMGYDNGDVKLFDLRTQKMLHEMNVSNGVCDLEFDRPDILANKMIVSCLEGRVRVYDLRTLHPQLGYAFVEERVSDGTVWCSRALPQNREIFMSGGGGSLSLHRYQYPPERVLKDSDGCEKGVPGALEELNKVKVGDQPINAMDWNRAKEGLLACTSFDQSVRVMLVTKLGLVV